MKLNIGCGDHYAPGWTNTDLHDDAPGGPRPDVVCSIFHLPFPDASVERVYCGHLLEHVRLDELSAALAEVRRVLADDGELMVVGPDINLTRLHEPALADMVIYGAERWPGDEHCWRATGGTTLAFVMERFDARLMPIGDVGLEWPVVDRVAPWQFALHAKPKEHECRKQLS